MKLTTMTTTGATGAFGATLSGCLCAAPVAVRTRVAVGSFDAVSARAITSARDAVDVPTPVHVRPGGDDG